MPLVSVFFFLSFFLGAFVIVYHAPHLPSSPRPPTSLLICLRCRSSLPSLVLFLCTRHTNATENRQTGITEWKKKVFKNVVNKRYMQETKDDKIRHGGVKFELLRRVRSVDWWGKASLSLLGFEVITKWEWLDSLKRFFVGRHFDASQMLINR